MMDVLEKLRLSITAAPLVLAMGEALPAYAQTNPVLVPAVNVVQAASPAVTAPVEISDPSAGHDWLLVPDRAHPERPARWVRIARNGAEPQAGARGENGIARDAAPPIVIHPGDRLVVEEHSSVVDAQLAAVALNAAVRGGELRARLEIGGRVVRGVAVDRNRALLAPQSRSAR
jgi:hypothetical protein